MHASISVIDKGGPKQRHLYTLAKENNKNMFKIP